MINDFQSPKKLDMDAANYTKMTELIQRGVKSADLPEVLAFFKQTPVYSFLYTLFAPLHNRQQALNDLFCSLTYETYPKDQLM